MLNFINKNNKMVINILFISTILFGSFSALLWWKGNFTGKVLMKFGLQEEAVSPDYWALKGWEKSLNVLNVHSDVLFLGDSITYGSDFQNDFKNIKIGELGYPGDTLKGMINRADMVKDLSPKKIFILGGINDLSQGASSNDIYDRYEKLIKKLKRNNPNATLYLQSILPINTVKKDTRTTNKNIIEANKKIKLVTKKENLVYIDLFSLYYKDGQLPSNLTIDGIHLYPDSYRFWENEIKQYIYN